MSGPATVDAFLDAAVDAGAEVIKPAAKSLWGGYGGVVQAPDGTIWKVATSAKKDTGPVTREIDEVVLLLGVDDVKATKRFYVERGLTVGRSFGGKYAEFTSGASSPVKLALYKRRGSGQGPRGFPSTARVRTESSSAAPQEHSSILTVSSGRRQRAEGGPVSASVANTW